MKCSQNFCNVTEMDSERFAHSAGTNQYTQCFVSKFMLIPLEDRQNYSNTCEMRREFIFFHQLTSFLS